MRNPASLATLLLLAATTLPVCASGLDNKNFNQQSIDMLTTRASLAQPREQCFLYAELMHQMTEFSLRQYAAGDFDHAANLLRQVQQIAQKLHLSVIGHDEKRLKGAEILLRHTSFRLAEMLHASSSEDRPLVEQTLAEVNQAQNEAMLQVFSK
jgi:hypothetical protein